MPSIIRKPAVAGLFYPAQADRLRSDVAGYLAKASVPTGPVPKAIVVPHAGYIYSGQAAAAAYVLLSPHADIIRRVILLGPNHRVALSGMALSRADQFMTPLGPVEIDQELRAKVTRLPGIIEMDQAHLEEHSLEVQLPFLQSVLNDFKVLPVVVGEAPAKQVSKLLEAVWGGPETLIIISTDLSHFHSYNEAQTLDSATSQAILEFNGDAISQQHACGRNPLKGLLLSAQRHGLKARQLALCNSGDSAGSKDRVVGYGAYAFNE